MEYCCVVGLLYVGMNVLVCFFIDDCVLVLVLCCVVIDLVWYLLLLCVVIMCKLVDVVV